MKILQGFDAGEKWLKSQSQNLSTNNHDIYKLLLEMDENIRNKGDKALTEYNKKFDKRDLTLPQDIIKLNKPIEHYEKALSKDLVHALKLAKSRIEKFHKLQKPKDLELNEQVDGAKICLKQRFTPLERIALYVPGGKASYPSTVLMTAVPAKLAGIKEIILLCPNPSPAVLYSAALAGVKKIVPIGGAQAVMAVAIGTKSIPIVDKVFGPGNAYVTAAKKFGFGSFNIDMLAGPTEILVAFDNNSKLSEVAADILSQAEHDEMARPMAVCSYSELAKELLLEIERQLEKLPKKAICNKALQNHGAIFVVENPSQVIEIINKVAPEHLELHMENAEKFLPEINNAGAIFVGSGACESLGDYVLGTNHVLPTSGSSRFFSALGLQDFYKRQNIAIVDGQAKSLLKAASTIAAEEGLDAHKFAAEIRLKD